MKNLVPIILLLCFFTVQSCQSGGRDCMVRVISTNAKSVLYVNDAFRVGDTITSAGQACIVIKDLTSKP